MVGDRRYGRRIPKDDGVDLRYLASDGTGAHAAARLRDLSTTGACLEIAQPIRVATVIAFEHAGRGFKATVRYCKKTPGAFLIGVEFEDPLA